MFSKFISIFLSKFPDRLACLVIIVGILCMGSFAYETVGLPIGAASAQGGFDGTAATTSAISWIYTQKCFGDHVQPETMNTSVRSEGSGLYGVRVDFVSLEYTIDLETGGLHHVPVNHTVDMVVSQDKIVTAVENYRDMANAPVRSLVVNLGREYV
jgi:hypothetical protein